MKAEHADSGAAKLIQRFLCACGYLDEDLITVGAPVDAVEYQAVQLDVEVGGEAKALDQRGRAAVVLR